MRFIYVLFLVLWQFTAIPFVAMLTSYTMTSDRSASPQIDNLTIVYKTPVDNSVVYD